MMNKLLYLLPLFSALPLFLSGALRRPPAPPESAFRAAPVALGPDVAPLVADPAGLLGQAIDRLAPARVAWLRVDLWQRMTAGDVAYESTGTLQLGPKQCARLDVAVQTSGAAARWLVVSDGRAYVHVVKLGDDAPVVTSRLFIPDDPDPALPAPRPAGEALIDLGCGGPHAVLKDLRSRLRATAAQTGHWRGHAVVCVSGRLDSAQAVPAAGTAAAADFCYLYLDAQTLWPARIEWWGPDARRVSRPMLEMEFRDPHVNEPLSLPDCIRTFSYQPEGGG